MKELDLGTGNIGSLIKRFSIPCVISMVVAALYNIVDQIFIGWSEAGAYGNAATNIVYPFTVLALGLALLVGDGAAAGFSIALGRRDKRQANKNIGNGLVILILLAVILCAIGFVCRTQILGLFGGNPDEVECYGYETFASTGEAYGAVIPLAVVGIVMKVFGIVVSIVIGISLGGQPIIGFNMGAGNMIRVKETILLITKLVLIISVSNPGEEIPMSERQKLFERFYRTDSSHEFSGHYGLGLAIAKSIADVNDAKITVECNDGLVIFNVIFPSKH